MDDPALAAAEIFGDRPEPMNEHGLPGVFQTRGESADGTDTEPPRQKLDIGPFARFPNKFFGSGIGRKVGRSPSLLYFALCENANRNREPSNTFKASDKALESETGLSARTIRNARIKLWENGLVEYSREPGESYTYTLLRPDLKWLKRADRPRHKQRPRAMAVRMAKQER